MATKLKSKPKQVEQAAPEKQSEPQSEPDSYTEAEVKAGQEYCAAMLRATTGGPKQDILADREKQNPRVIKAALELSMPIPWRTGHVKALLDKLTSDDAHTVLVLAACYWNLGFIMHKQSQAKRK